MNRMIALVVALATERRALERCLPSLQRKRGDDGWPLVGDCCGQRVVVLQAGIGSSRARSALLLAARRLSITSAWSVGFAGGLDPDLQAGDLICPEAVLRDVDGAAQRLLSPPGCQVVQAALAGAGLPLHAGGLLTVDGPLRSPQEKAAAFRRTGALAVDMEAAGVAEAAAELQIPWLALKAVADPAALPLPEFVNCLTTVEGNLRWAALLGSLLVAERRQALRRLGQAAARAAACLQRGLPVALQAWATLTPNQISG